MKKRILERARELATAIEIPAGKLAELEDNLKSDYVVPEITREYGLGTIDHTVLSFNATEADVTRICEEAHKFGFFAICINPVWIPLANGIREKLGATFKIATVIDFPLGASTLEARIAETDRALSDGADEIDLVISIGLLKSGKTAETFKLMREVAKRGGYLKVILESSELTEEEKIDAALLAFFAGAHMLKTSTGVNGKATAEDVKILRAVAGKTLGVKAAGGIRDKETLLKMVEAGADRIGCSSSVKIFSAW